MADIYRYISFIFLFVQVLYSEYHCAAAYSVRLIPNGHNCARGRVAPDSTTNGARGKTQNCYMGILPWESQLFNQLLATALTREYHRILL